MTDIKQLKGFTEDEFKLAQRDLLLFLVKDHAEPDNYSIDRPNTPAAAAVWDMWREQWAATHGTEPTLEELRAKHNPEAWKAATLGAVCQVASWIFTELDSRTVSYKGGYHANKERLDELIETVAFVPGYNAVMLIFKKDRGEAVDALIKNPPTE